MSGGERIRTFIAIEPGEAARRSALEASTELRERAHGDGVRWVAPEGMHVTLRFLGDVEVAQVPDLGERVGEAVADEPAFELSLADVDAFPNPRRPRVVVVGLTPHEPAERLARVVERAVVAIGFPPEERPFRAHLTLGRVRRGRRAPAIAPAPSVAPAAFPVREVVLFQSQVSREGAVYTALRQLPLARGPRAH